MKLYSLVYDGNRYACHHYDKSLARIFIHQLLKETYGEEKADKILAEEKIKVRQDSDQIAFVIPEGNKLWSV